jgi:hypothetical protein
MPMKDQKVIPLPLPWPAKLRVSLRLRESAERAREDAIDRKRWFLTIRTAA